MDERLGEVRAEVAKNLKHVRWATAPEVGADLVFVDGRMWIGEARFGRMKGIGWESGRTVQVDLPGVPETAEAFLVSLSFGRLRRLVPSKVPGTWDVVEPDP